MRIHIDKVNSPPLLGLNLSKLKAILSYIPPEWLSDVKEIHLTSSLVPTNSRWGNSDASFSRYSGRLTIFSRGKINLQLVMPILEALAGHHFGFSYRRGQHLSDEDSKRLSSIVAPLSQRIVAAIKTEQGAAANP